MNDIVEIGWNGPQDPTSLELFDAIVAAVRQRIGGGEIEPLRLALESCGTLLDQLGSVMSSGWMARHRSMLARHLMRYERVGGALDEAVVQLQAYVEDTPMDEDAIIEWGRLVESRVEDAAWENWRLDQAQKKLRSLLARADVNPETCRIAIRLLETLEKHKERLRAQLERGHEYEALVRIIQQLHRENRQVQWDQIIQMGSRAQMGAMRLHELVEQLVAEGRLVSPLETGGAFYLLDRGSPE